MAVLVFYGGAGINVISYCCKECRSAGMEALLNEKCCEIHHHNHNTKEHNHNNNSSTSFCHIAHVKDDICHGHDNPMHAEGNCCDSEHSDSQDLYSEHSCDDCCNMERIDFDWSTQNFDELMFDLSPIMLDLFSDNLYISSSAHLLLTCENNTVMPNGPPLVLPRDYLSILTVLLI